MPIVKLYIKIKNFNLVVLCFHEINETFNVTKRITINNVLEIHKIFLRKYKTCTFSILDINIKFI